MPPITIAAGTKRKYIESFIISTKYKQQLDICCPISFIKYFVKKSAFA